MKRIRRGIIAGGLIAAGLTAIVLAQGVIEVDSKIPAYRPVSGISGNMSSVGSDTLNNLMALWAEAFHRAYPNTRIQIEGKGSSTAPPALISGTAQLGPMSREMKGSEVDAFEKKFGYKPTRFRVAVDALAVFVNKDNPIKGLTMAQVDAIFSKARRAGYGTDITTWGQLGLKGDWARRPISLYGRNSASGTYGFFKEFVMENGDYKDTVKEQPGSAAVVQGVTVDRYGIGYSGIGYKTSGVRVAPLAKKANGKFYNEAVSNVYDGAYPLTRFLYINVNKAPGRPLDPMTREFMKLVLSKQGQQEVVKAGYFPLPAGVVQEDLKKIR